MIVLALVALSRTTVQPLFPASVHSMETTKVAEQLAQVVKDFNETLAHAGAPAAQHTTFDTLTQSLVMYLQGEVTKVALSTIAPRSARCSVRVR